MYEDVPKTDFRVGSSKWYKFTLIPFGSGSSFCHLLKICLDNQLFITLLLYLDDTCVFAASIDKILDRMALVFKRLKAVLSVEDISANPKKWRKSRIGQC